MRLAKWWRTEPKITVATTEQLVKRIEQLELASVQRGSRILCKHVFDFEAHEQPGLIRGKQDEILGAYDPSLGAFMLDPVVKQAGRELMDKLGDRLPESIKRALENAAAARWGDLPALQSSSVAWRDLLTPRRVLAADGTQVLNTTTETIMCPDFTFAADYMEVGDAFKYTLLFDVSTVITSPGTQTYRLRWGGVGGTSLAASGAFTPDNEAASTTVTQMLEWYLVVRSVGSAGSMLAIGRFTPNDFDDDTAATIVGNLNMLMAPVSAAAATGSLDTTTAKALSPTVAFSVSTATTQLTNHIAMLESID